MAKKREDKIRLGKILQAKRKYKEIRNKEIQVCS